MVRWNGRAACPCEQCARRCAVDGGSARSSGRAGPVRRDVSVCRAVSSRVSVCPLSVSRAGRRRAACAARRAVHIPWICTCDVRAKSRNANRRDEIAQNSSATFLASCVVLYDMGHGTCSAHTSQFAYLPFSFCSLFCSWIRTGPDTPHTLVSRCSHRFGFSPRRARLPSTSGDGSQLPRRAACFVVL